MSNENDLAVEFDDDNEEYPESTVASTSQAMTHISRPPHLAMIAPCPVQSPLLGFHLPAFSEFSGQKNRRALVAHFCNQLSHLMVFREETGNPFTDLVLPLTYKSRPVENAIYALASAHLEYRGVNNKEQSLHFHNEAIQGLASMIDNKGKSADRNELLAAIMLLVYYEVVCDHPTIRESIQMLTTDTRAVGSEGSVEFGGRTSERRHDYHELVPTSNRSYRNVSRTGMFTP